MSAHKPTAEPVRHTSAPWEAQPFDAEETGIALIGLPLNGMVAWVTLHPTEIDAQDATRAEANAAFIIDCVNSHASLKARAERAEQAVDVLESNARVQAKLLADTWRHAEKLESAARIADKHLDALGYGEMTKARKALRAALLPGTPAVSR